MTRRVPWLLALAGGLAVALALLAVLVGRGDAGVPSCHLDPRAGGVAGIGDSLTSGLSDIPNGVLGRDSWLNEAVCSGRLPYAYNAARPNLTSAEVEHQVDEVLSYRPRVAVLTIGTNDGLKGLPPERTLARIRDMCERLQAAGVRPVLGTLPPFEQGVTTVPPFNAALKRMAASMRLPVIDFYAVLEHRGHYGPGLTREGLHPSLAGAKMMADAAVPVVQAEFARQ